MKKERRQKDLDVKVLKFGGTSLCDGEHMRKAAEIVLSDRKRRYVVVSAPGKRGPDDIKMTDLLYAFYNEPCVDKRVQMQEAVQTRFRGMAEALGVSPAFSEELLKMASAEQRLYGRDYFVSRGEYFCGKLFAAYLGYDFLDAASLIFFLEDGSLDVEKTRRVLSAELLRHERAVIPGFYGSMPNGTVKTFPRGGSDITGAVVAAAVGASVYENFTDVSGFMLADPKTVDKSVPIGIITYRELRRLSYMGANVLHEDAVFPVRMAGIPINIRNTARPDDRGTWIVPKKEKKGRVCGITGKGGFALIHVIKDRIGEDTDAERELLSVFRRRGITVYGMPRSVDSVGVAVSAKDIEGRRDYLLHEITQYTEPCSVFLTAGIALLSVVGEDMPSSVYGKVFTALAELSEKPLILDGGADELGFTVGIREENLRRTIRLLYERLKDEADIL